MTTFLLTAIAILGPPVVAYCIWRAISSARTPEGAVAWAVFLISTPWLGVPVFLFLGRRKLADYAAAWRDSHALTGPYGAGEVLLADAGEQHRPLKALERIGGLPFAKGNDVRLLIDGKATFDAICTAIEAAERSVCVQFYIIRDDTLGRRVARCLAAAATRGVAVRVMFDGVGSQRLASSWSESLRAAGVVVLNPDTSRGPTSRLNINFRNHRKTVVIDGSIAFIGGHNIGDEYLGQDPSIGAWRDTHLELRGPVAAQVQKVFAEDWHWASREKLGEGMLAVAQEAHPANKTAALVPTGPGDDLDSGSLMFFTAITSAKDRIWIASPYFVPDTDILAALVAAALAGKDVRIILPEAIDHYLPWLAAHAYFDEVRAAGVKIYRYTPGFMHQKVILVDNDLAAVGTANLDNRSFRLNFESTVFIWDQSFAQEVEAMLEADMARSSLQPEMSDMPFLIRIGAPMARLLAPVL